MSAHVWKFFRAGGFDQVKLENGADLMHLNELDLKLWTALACPTTGLEFDPATAALIDTDHDGRIRASELMAAIQWAGSMLADPDELVRGGDTLAFSAIADPTLRAAAKRICTNLGKVEASSVTLADAVQADKSFSGTTFNGDGVIIEASAGDESSRRAFRDIAACMGTVPDRSGDPGIDQAKVDAFFDACAAYDGWYKAAEANRASVLPAGDATAAAAGAVRAVRDRADDFYRRCRLAAYDPRALALLEQKEADAVMTAAANDAAHNGSHASVLMAGLAVAQPAAGRAMPLESGVNPAHAAAVAALRADAVRPLLGERAELSEPAWQELQGRLAAFEDWRGAQAGAAVEPLGIARVRELLAGGARETLTALVAQDQALAPEVAAIANVERLIRYKRDLFLLCVNFVSFRDFYDAGEPAIFQAGTLYLDQRSCTLTLAVEDGGRHAAMAALAGSYLAYCDCARRGAAGTAGSVERRQIVAAFTNGDADNLMVGRNGLFIDRAGRDWDATITKIIENPISIRQAFWAPYKKLVRMIEEQVAKRAADADAAAEKQLKATATGIANVDQAKPPEKKVDIGTVAALGVAFGALATAFAAIAGYLSGLVKLPFWQVCLAVVVLLLLVSGPSMMIAWLKLSRRNMGPILDANGWAVNARAKLNVPFGASLTGVAKLPPGHKLTVEDRFGERRSPWPKLVMFLIVLGFVFSLLNDLYVLDYAWYAATGKHNPEFKRPPAEAVERSGAR
jgi:hypothetical protein